MMKSFEKIDVHISLKIHLIWSHREIFEKQLPSESDEQGERFHQTLKEFEERFQGKRLDSMLADFCWSIVMEP